MDGSVGSYTTQPLNSAVPVDLPLLHILQVFKDLNRSHTIFSLFPALPTMELALDTQPSSSVMLQE